MLPTLSTTVIVLVFLGSSLFAAPAFAASVTAATLQKAKQAADAKGCAFIASHDEILANAKKEGKLRVQSSSLIATAYEYGVPLFTSAHELSDDA